MKSTKKILGASAALGLAVALSAGSTFAWFVTSGRTTAQVNGIDVNVVSQVDGGETLNVYVPTVEALSADSTLASQATNSQFVAAVTPNLTTKPNLQPLTLLQVVGDKWKLRTQNNTDTNSDSEDSGFLYFTVAFTSSAPLEIYLDTTEADNRGLKENKSSVLPGTVATATDDNTIDWTTGQTGAEGFDSHLFNVDAEPTPAFGDYYGDVSGLKDVSNPAVSTGTMPTTIRLEARAANATRLLFEELAPAIASGENAYTPSKLVWSPNEANYSGAEVVDKDWTVTTTPTNAKGFWKNNLARDYNVLKTQLRAGDSLALPETDAYTQKDYSANDFNALIPYVATLSGDANKPQENNNLTGANAATKIATLKARSDLNTAGIVFADGKSSNIAPVDYLADDHNELNT